MSQTASGGRALSLSAVAAAEAAVTSPTGGGGRAADGEQDEQAEGFLLHHVQRRGDGEADHGEEVPQHWPQQGKLWLAPRRSALIDCYDSSVGSYSIIIIVLLSNHSTSLVSEVFSPSSSLSFSVR